MNFLNRILRNSNRSSLRRISETYNVKSIANAGNGNCYFHSLAQIKKWHGSEELTVQEERNALHEYFINDFTEEDLDINFSEHLVTDIRIMGKYVTHEYFYACMKMHKDEFNLVFLCMSFNRLIPMHPAAIEINPALRTFYMYFDIDGEHIEAVETLGTYLEVEEVAKLFSIITSKDKI